MKQVVLTFFLRPNPLNLHNRNHPTFDVQRYKIWSVVTSSYAATTTA